MLTLFPDEKVVSQSSDKSVILTSHRLCYEYREWGRSYNQNIMLEHITSCENFSKKQYTLLLIGAFLCIIGVAQALDNNMVLAAPAIAAGLIFIFFYWRTQSSMITIASPSTRMNINVTGMRRESVLNFINTIEQTKHQRLMSLNNRINYV